MLYWVGLGDSSDGACSLLVGTSSVCGGLGGVWGESKKSLSHASVR